MSGIIVTAFDDGPGVYGKIPSLGDFISRRLPGDFIDCWDNWLQSAITESQAVLGPDWLDVYLVSPIWSFILPRGICGASAWAGILLPSVDKVGRYFPLTLAVRVPAGMAGLRLFSQGKKLFHHLEQMGLSALADNFDINEFDGEIRGPLTYDHSSFQECDATVKCRTAHAAFSIEMGSPENMPNALTALSDALISEFMPNHSIWRHSGAERVKPCLRLYENLPPAGAYAHFLTDFIHDGEGA